MKKTLFTLVFLLVALGVFAVPARKKPFVHTQSNGTQISLVLVGDEHLHYFVNTATDEKMLCGDDGDFYVISDAEMTSMKKVASERRAMADASRQKRLNSHMSASQAGNGPHKIGTFGNMTGSKKGLVILVNFQDEQMAASHTQSTFEDQFNLEGYNEGGHLGSVHDFFYDQSYGLFDLTFDVVGPVTVSHDMKYYGKKGTTGNDDRPATMVSEACKLADEAGIDFSDYDWDGDGEVDQVYVIYAGYGEAYGASSNTIWPHEWNLSSAGYWGDGDGALFLDGVYIDTYACSCELSGTTGSVLNGIGTACHEFSHCLGYPDFYDTDYSGAFGMNAWDVMDAGSYNGPGGCGEVPAGYTSYERWMAGWLTPIELSTPKTIRGMASLEETPEAYIIYNDKHSDEYILLENRQNEKWFKYVDNYTTPHGLLAIHVDYSANAWANDKPNDNPSHMRMSIIPGSNHYGTYYSYYNQYSCSKSDLENHPFGGSSSYTTLNGTTHTNTGGKWFNTCSTGNKTLNHEITEVSNADDGTITFLFDGGYSDDGKRFTIVYNTGTGACETESWTQVEFQEKAVLPVVTSPSEDWTFVGWSTTECTEEVAELPENILSAEAEYEPMEDVIFYAVYKRVETVDEVETNYYSTYPEASALAVPTVAFTAENITASVGDVDVTNAAVVEGSEGNVIYTTSNSKVVTVDAATGMLSPCGVGEAVITATVATVAGVATSAHSTYNVSVLMPTLSSIEVTTLPDVTEYWEGEKFKKNGMVVTATYENGYTSEVTEYTYEPSKNKELELTDTEVTVTYTEGDVTAIATFPITILERPKYTVTFDPGTGSCEVESLKEEKYQSGVVLPSATAINEDWTFVGWAKTSIEDTNGRPDVTGSGYTFKPKADITLYAVYRHTDEEIPDVFQYTSHIVEGGDYVIVSANAEGEAYVLDSENISEAASKEIAGTEVQIVNYDVTPTIEVVPASAIWTLTGSSSEMQLKNGDNFLSLKGNGLSVTAEARDIYWSNSFGLYGKSPISPASYYVHPEGSTFKVDTKSSNTKRVYLYQKVDSKIYTYSTNPKDTEDTAILEIKNTAAGNGSLYNLNGQRINTPVRGNIYIKNGQKYLQK